MAAPRSTALVLLACLAGCGDGSTLADAGAVADARTAPDAFSPDDAFSSEDAFSSTDVFSSTDAFSSDDAFSTTDAPSDLDAACMRPTGINLDGLGADCSATPCAAGLECLGISGVVFQQVCGIPCEVEDGGECACPTELVCGARVDKAGTHHECVRPDA
jgi:hypothetical protein